MQHDVGMEFTFRLVYVIYECICTDKRKDACTEKVKKANSYTLHDVSFCYLLYFPRYDI